MEIKDFGFTTTVLHSDRQKSIEHGAIRCPIYPSVPFHYQNPHDLAAVFQGKKSGYYYARSANPTVDALEEKITRMENGIGSVCFSTGMAAIGALGQAFLKAGDHFVSSSFLFGSTHAVWHNLACLSVENTLVDATDIAKIKAAIKPNTRIVFVETIANPRTQVADLAAIGELCHEQSILFVVDNTLTSPYFFRPKSVGASLSLNSLSKSIAGHGQGLGGALTDTGCFDWSCYPHITEVSKRKDPAFWGLAQLRKEALNNFGATLSPEVAHAISLGSETLALRMDRSAANALALTKMLSLSPQVSKVYYPGLENHPQYARSKSIFKNSGYMFSFELQDGLDCFEFLKHLKIPLISTHLGDTRTLALPIAHTVFFASGPELRAQMGIADSLIRVSTGIEDINDLLADFSHALSSC